MPERAVCLRSASKCALLLAAGCLALSAAQAQTSPAAGGGAANARSGQSEAQAQLPKLEVASIKPHKAQGMRMRASFRLLPDGVSFVGLPLSLLVSEAFGLPDSRILNEPPWAKSARYDIQAKVDPAEAPELEKLTRQERMAMLIPLLEERFGLKFHHETKAMEVYSLVVAKGGPKLKLSAGKKGGPIAGAAKAGESPDESPKAGGSKTLKPDEPGGGAMPPPGGGGGPPPRGAGSQSISLPR